MPSERVLDRLEHLVENADRIAEYLDGMTAEGYVADRMTIDACERCLERVIEATVKIGAERMAEILPSQSPAQIRSMGNFLRHDYDVVDANTVYITLTQRVPELRAAAAAEIVRIEREAAPGDHESDGETE